MSCVEKRIGSTIREAAVAIRYRPMRERMLLAKANWVVYSFILKRGEPGWRGRGLHSSF